LKFLHKIWLSETKTCRYDVIHLVWWMA